MNLSASNVGTDLQPHPAANYFEMMDDGAFQELKADIAHHGLLLPIWLCDGKILDGRNRYRACCELSIEPRFQIYECDSPVECAWALNGKRRHLTVSQRAAIAAEMLPALKEETRKRQLSTLKRGDVSPVPPDPVERGNSVEAVIHAARIVGVGKTSVQNAHTVKNADPALFSEVKAGKITVESAHRIVTRRAQEPPSIPVHDKQPREQRIADIQRLAADGNRAVQIAESMGIGEQRVRGLAREAGIILPDAQIGKTRAIHARRVISETVNALEGLAMGIDTLNGSLAGISVSEATEYVNSMTQSLRAIGRIKSKLLELSNGR